LSDKYNISIYPAGRMGEKRFHRKAREPSNRRALSFESKMEGKHVVYKKLEITMIFS